MALPGVSTKRTLVLLFPLLSTGAVAAFDGRPHLFFIEGSIGDTSAAALERESEIINGQGSFYWRYNGNFYRYRTSRLTLTAGIGYEFIALEWMGLRALYSYTSHLHMMTASTGRGRYSRSSSLGGQVAETSGFFVGPVFRYLPFDQKWFAIEIPLQWGIHAGQYTPLTTYSEIRELNNQVPPNPEEHTRQNFQLQKVRYGIGASFFGFSAGFYASLSFYVEQGMTKTAVGPSPLMPAGSPWNSYLLMLAVGWRV